jgi:hypothetical protein
MLPNRPLWVPFFLYLCIRLVQFFKGGNNLARRHTLGVQAQDFVVQRGEAGLVLTDQLWLKTAIPVTRYCYLELAVFPFQGLLRKTIAAVPRADCWYFRTPDDRPIRHSTRLNRNLGQHLAERIEVFFGFYAFRRFAGKRLKFCFVHDAYPPPIMESMISNYTN